MKTITLTLPDDTPISELRRFAERQGCELRLSGVDHFTLLPPRKSDAKVVPFNQGRPSQTGPEVA